MSTLSHEVKWKKAKFVMNIMELIKSGIDIVDNNIIHIRH